MNNLILYITITLIAVSSSVDAQKLFQKSSDLSLDDLISGYCKEEFYQSTVKKMVMPHTKDSVYIYAKILVNIDTIKHRDIEDYVLETKSLVIHALISIDSTSYYHTIVDTVGFQNNGNEETVLDTVFIANCDSDTDNEMFLTFYTFYNRHGYAGNVYKTYAYNFPSKNYFSWTMDEKISQLFEDKYIGKIDNDEDETHDNENETNTEEIAQGRNKYSSVTNIKSKLRELGY